MALIPYLNQGDPVTAARWNTFYAEIDARLARNFGDQSILLWGNGVDFGVGTEPPLYYSRRFYFFPPGSTNPTWDSMAQAWFELEPDTFSPYFRRYDHDVFSQIVAALPIAEPPPGDPRPVKDDDWPVVRLAVDDIQAYSTHWAPLIWPDGVPGNDTSLALDALLVSLEAHQRNIDGKDYFVFIDYSQGPEYFHKFTPVEIILGDIGPTFDFPNHYNKYNVFRFHNLQGQAVTVSFGAHFSFTIPPMGCKCVRRTGVTYTLGFRYFHTCLPGDPWFLKWDGGPPLPGHSGSVVFDLRGKTDWSNVTDIFCGVHVGAWLYRNSWNESYERFPQQYDHTKIWNVEPIYCNPDYQGGKFEVQTPALGYFPAVDDSVPIGDLCFHRGKLLIVDPAGSFRVSRIQPITVPALEQPPRQFVLRKADGSVALGVEDVTVSRAGESIPASSGSDVNWLVDSVLDDTFQPLSFYIVLVPRDFGNDPKLSVGDEVKVTFTHLTDDQKYLLEFEGMASLAAKLAEAGITLTMPVPGGNADIAIPEKRFQLTADTPRDIISLSCNLISGVFGVPARTIGTGAGGSPALVFPFLGWFLPLFGLDLQTDEVTARWIVWDLDSDGNYIDVHWDELTYETNSYVSSGQNEDDSFWTFFDTIGDLLTYFRSKGNSLATQADISMTIFGPMINWSQSVALKYPINGFASSDFELKPAGVSSWKFERGGLAPLRGTPEGQAIPPIAGSTNFGWPNYLPYPQWAGGDFPAVRPRDVATCFPRFERLWQNHRFFNHDSSPFAALNAPSGITSEHPMMKSFYESKPFEDGKPLPVAKAPAHAKAGISFLAPFPSGCDILTRLSAWLNYSMLTFQSPTGPQVYNFNRGQAWQIAYYGNLRSHILANQPVDADGAGLARNALPIEIEHYNAAASAMNAITGAPGGPGFLSDVAYALFGQFGLSPGKGLGYKNFRPRNMWVWWDDEVSPEISPWMESKGVTVSTRDDLPGSLASYLNRIQTWAVWDPTHGGPSITDTVVTPFGPRTVSMHEAAWGDYLFGATQFDPSLNDGHGGNRTPTLEELQDRLDRLRWLTIDDAKALHAALGIPFSFDELVVPCKLVFKEANWTQLDSRSGSGLGGRVLSRAVGFVNRDDGDWVLDNDAGNAIRASVGQADFCLYTMAWGSVEALYDADYAELQERFYPDDGPPVPATQHIRANRFYLWRGFDGPNARCVVFPRNYADYLRNWDNSLVRYHAPGGFSHIPRRAVADLEEGEPEVTDLRTVDPSNPDEAIIATEYENAVFSIYPYGTPF